MRLYVPIFCCSTLALLGAVWTEETEMQNEIDNVNGLATDIQSRLIEYKFPLDNLPSVAASFPPENVDLANLPDPFNFWPAEVFSLFVPFKAPVFVFTTFLVYACALYSMKHNDIDHFMAVDGSAMIFFSCMTLNDFFCGYSAKYLDESTYMTSSLLLLRVVTLAVYGLQIFKLKLPYVQKSLSGNILPVNNALLTGVFLYFISTNEEYKNNPRFFVYAAGPLIFDGVCTAMEIKKDNRSTFDAFAGWLVKFQNSKSGAVALNVSTGLLWTAYLVAMTPRLREYLHVKQSHFRVFWMGFTALYTVPKLMDLKVFPKAFSRISNVYFKTRPLELVKNFVGPVLVTLQQYQNHIILVCAAAVPILPLVGFYSYLIEPFTQIIFPAWIFSPVTAFIYEELPLLLKFVRFALTFNFFRFMISGLGYLLGCVLIRDFIYGESFLTSSYDIYHEASDATSAAKNLWDQTVENARKSQNRGHLSAKHSPHKLKSTGGA